MAIKKLKQTGEDNNGVYNSMDGLSFARALNNNKEELGTETKVDLDVHNTPEALRKAFKEQAGKIGYHTPGGPDDIFTHEEEGAPVDSPSELKDGLAQIYNKALETPPAPTLTGISITTAPDKVDYDEGDLFDPTGMVVTAEYDDGSTEEVTDYTYSPVIALTTTDTEITIIYEGKTVTQTITVS